MREKRQLKDGISMSKKQTNYVLLLDYSGGSLIKIKLTEEEKNEAKKFEDFEDFLAKCADYGILVDYNPDHKIDLKFMLAEQKERNPRAKFTRAKTLGYFYEGQQIRRRIES